MIMGEIMGEVKSTNNLNVQNAIYAVGCLQQTPPKQLLDVTPYKNKSAHIRLTETNREIPNWEAVSLKSYGTTP